MGNYKVNAKWMIGDGDDDDDDDNDDDGDGDGCKTTTFHSPSQQLFEGDSSFQEQKELHNSKSYIIGKEHSSFFQIQYMQKSFKSKQMHNSH